MNSEGRKQSFHCLRTLNYSLYVETNLHVHSRDWESILSYLLESQITEENVYRSTARGGRRTGGNDWWNVSGMFLPGVSIF